MRKSIAAHVWFGLTPLGRWTIGVPLIAAVYLGLAIMLPLIVVVFVLAKARLLDSVERGLGVLGGLFFKGKP